MITWGYFAMVIFLARCTLRFASFLLWIFFPPLFAEKENSYIHLQEVSFSHGAYTAIIFFSPAVASDLWVYVYCLIDTKKNPQCRNAENQSLFQPVLEYRGSVEGNIC